MSKETVRRRPTTHCARHKGTRQAMEYVKLSALNKERRKKVSSLTEVGKEPISSHVRGSAN